MIINRFKLKEFTSHELLKLAGQCMDMDTFIIGRNGNKKEEVN
ncbi:hypothetical protein [Methylomonas koyamae]|nr:hypothetical protein [Methylomonas koyamae]